MSRNTVARYRRGEHMPWESKGKGRDPAIVTGETEEFFRSCLEQDKNLEVPKKQHHTARRI
ncbi:MAG: Transposase [Synergistales bacterium 53_16]|nr:MAG: Transposase [Synergistales bacterium 53_16]